MVTKFGELNLPVVLIAQMLSIRFPLIVAGWLLGDECYLFHFVPSHCRKVVVKTCTNQDFAHRSRSSTDDASRWEQQSHSVGFLGES